MYTRVKKLSINYNDHSLNPLWVILDQYSSPPVLPLLFTTFLSQLGIVFESRDISDETSRKRIRELVEKDISDLTIRSYVYCLSRFLSYLEYCHEHKNTQGMHASSATPEWFVNHYLNHELANNLGSSDSLNTHRSALVAYFNWLSYMEICPRLNLSVYRKTRQLIAEKTKKEYYIQYVSNYSRSKLLIQCKTLGEKLMMRMGYEVGLRSKELMGLRLSDDNSLLVLFEQLDSEEHNHTTSFPYHLKGKYTKGSKSRWIYFDRFLLQDMKRYYETERQWLIDQAGSDDSSFFLRTSHKFIGTGIGTEQATRVFRKRAKSAGLNTLLKFHDLRHTFATELFHSELVGFSGRETRSESAALIVVAQRLGHTIGNDGYAPAVTTRYIRMRLQMLKMENVSER